MNYQRCYYHQLQQSSEQKVYHARTHADSKIHGTNMGPIWGRQDPGGPHVGSMKFAIWTSVQKSLF